MTLKPSASETITVGGEPGRGRAQDGFVDQHRPRTDRVAPRRRPDFQKLAFLTRGSRAERGGFRFIGEARSSAPAGTHRRPPFSSTRRLHGPGAGSGPHAFQPGPSASSASSPTASIPRSADVRRRDLRRQKSARRDARKRLRLCSGQGPADEKSAFEQSKKRLLRATVRFALGGSDPARPFSSFSLPPNGLTRRTSSFPSTSGAFPSLAADVDIRSIRPFSSECRLPVLVPQTGGIHVVYDKYSEDNFRVGGLADPSYGQTLSARTGTSRSSTTGPSSAVSSNEARGQFGIAASSSRTNSNTVAEWYSSGNTLMRGGTSCNLLATGTRGSCATTFHYHFAAARLARHQRGASLQHVKDHSSSTSTLRLFLYLTDTKALPLAYAYGVARPT